MDNGIPVDQEPRAPEHLVILGRREGQHVGSVGHGILRGVDGVVPLRYRPHVVNGLRDGIVLSFARASISEGDIRAVVGDQPA